jgi:hypothetical protein
MTMKHESIAVTVALLILAGTSQHACGQGHPVRSSTPILEAATDTLHLRLLDAVTTRTIANTEVEIRSDNGIICVRSPCPTNARRWNGRTDAEGSVMVPIDALQVMTSIGTPAHRADLIADSFEAADGAWVVEMFPRERPAELDFHPLDLKLIDEASLSPIADTPVRIEIGSTGGFDGTTNSLGYIFVPVEVRLGDWPRAPVPRFARIIVAGYHTVQTDFAAANRKVLMTRRRD